LEFIRFLCNIYFSLHADSNGVCEMMGGCAVWLSLCVSLIRTGARSLQVNAKTSGVPHSTFAANKSCV